MTDTRATDQRIVERILAAIKTGHYESLKRSERQFEQLHARLASPETSDAEAGDDLPSVLAKDAGLLTETIIATAEETLNFAECEIEHFRNKKARRSLTDDEKRIGQECLLPLLSSLSELLAGTRNPK